ncbi:MAG: hypothetical protein ACTHOC_12235 [Luteimonas sp.]
MTTLMPDSHARKLRQGWVVAGFLFVLLSAAAIFRPATHGPFVFDDFPNLGNLSQLEGTIDRVHVGQYLAAFTGSPGRPLAALSFVIEDSAWPTDPEPYKRDNVLWHLICGVLVFALSRRIARYSIRSAPWADVIGLVVMAAWTLHPMQLSATMLVVQRMNILSSIAVLAGLLGYIGIIDSGRTPDLRRVAAAGSVLGIAAVVAFLCKENGVLIFAYACALNMTVLRPVVQRFAPWPRRILLTGCAAPILALAATALVAHQRIVNAYTNRAFTLPERLLTEPRILVDYLQTILLPRIGGQGIFHDNYPVSQGFLSPPTTALAIAFLIALIAAAWRMRRRYPVFAFAIGWYFAGHLIESTVWPLELYFEHRNYLPMIGPLYALAAAAVPAPKPYRIPAHALVGAWLLIGAGLTAINAPIWGSRGALATVWVQENPDSVRAVQMMASYQAESGDSAAARETLLAGLKRVPAARELAMQVTLLDCYTKGITQRQYRGMLDLARRVRFTQMLPDLATRFGREAREGRCKGTLPKDGFVQFANALLENPALRRDGRAVAYIYVELSKQAVHDRDLDSTMRYLDAAYDANKNPLVPRNQAVYLLTAGLPRDAMRYLRKSEETPFPFFDRWMLDVPSMNRNLWKIAEKMEKDLHDVSKPGPAQAKPYPASGNGDH